MKYIQSCLPPSYIESGTPILVKSEVNEETREAYMNIEMFNVMICINLLSLCCEGKSDLAEIKCQNEILNIQTCVRLYKFTGRFWIFKQCLLNYISNVYLNTSN